ncbi:hypothetical protein VPH35_050766 [Triticum aestivum]
MGEGACSKAAGFVGADDEEKQHKAMYETEVKKAARLQALEVVEEYRRAGKLHTYDMDKEWKKRFSRVAKLHPCPWGKHTAAEVADAEYTYHLEEDEDDFMKVQLYLGGFGNS